ncbi:MAG: hypothetical protein LKH78_04485 [Weizmannia coagulans]|nr:hypothetical protein [Heyndrickxia coagulans]WNE61982.1 hypothetical protein KIY57_02280 [Heyndrickxia coagulans]
MKDISLPERLSFVLHHPDERHFADPGAPLLSFITSMKDISLHGHFTFVLHHPDERHFAPTTPPCLSLL